MGMFKTTLFEALQCADSWDVNGYCMYILNIEGGVATLESDDDRYMFHDQERHALQADAEGDQGCCPRGLTTSITGPLQRVRVDAPVGRGRMRMTQK